MASNANLAPPRDAEKGDAQAAAVVSGAPRGGGGAGAGGAVALLTGGYDRPYTFGLAMALAAAGVQVDVIGGTFVDRPEFHTTPGITFLNLRGDKNPEWSRARKALSLAAYYLRLLRYAAGARPQVFHILWNNQAAWFDRTLLTALYRLRGKRIVLTAHNVNQAARDGRDSAANRLTLRTQYRLADAIIVHAPAMAAQLRSDFGVPAGAILTVPFPINDSVPVTGLTREGARAKLGLRPDDRVLLFFGQIRPNKGLEYLVRGLRILIREDPRYRLLIAGAPRRDAVGYLQSVREEIRNAGLGDSVVEHATYVTDEETEAYFKAADALVLPYRDVSQSGVLFLGFAFGLPAIATAVGGMPDAVVEGRNGALCNPEDPASIAAAVRRCLAASPAEAARRRAEIARRARETNSWARVAEDSAALYLRVVNTCRSSEQK